VRFAAIRLHYFVAYAIVGAYMPYLPVFLGDDLGMPDWQIGWVAGMYGMAVILSPPIVTYLADRRVSGRTLIAVAYALAAVTLAGLAIVDDFLPIVLLSLAFGMVYTPLFALLDGLTFSAMAHERAAGRPPPPYDRIRVWGSLGFMLPAFVLLFALRSAAGHGTGQAAIVAAAVAAGVGLLTVSLLPRLEPEARDLGLPGAAAWHVLRVPPTRHLAIPLALMFAAIAVFYGFYARLVTAVGVDPAWVGLVMNLGVLSELPFMFAAGPLLRRFSLRNILLFGAACLALRMLVLATVVDPRIIVASQLLHGPIVVAIYLIPPMYINFKAPPGVRNGVQGLYAMLCFGVARLLGSIAAGYAAGNGLAWAFALAAALAAVALVWLWLAFVDPEAELALRG
jgi:PPP family 3-phenylpropionic acid transporter